ncbi:MAG TPA: YneF family protein [Bacilli bacterium]|nr:YneF family protein [Bacilli bacterium]
MAQWLIDVLYLVGGLIAGAVLGFFIARVVTKKYLKKNPPINEEMIKALMMQMGRKPSQKQINQMMKSMEKYQ